MEQIVKNKQQKKLLGYHQQKEMVSWPKSNAYRNRSMNIREIKRVGIVQRVPDPVEQIVMEEDMAQVRQDVNAAMAILVAAIQNNVAMAEKLEGKVGRDAWVYAGFFRRNENLLQIINSWGPNWTIENTCGLLLDLGLALRDLCTSMEIMNNELSQGRMHGAHRVDRESEWALHDVPEGAAMQAGPSATTGQLLRLLNHFKSQINSLQIEAIMIGAVKYWRDGSFIKRLLGEYHTAVEVWAVYMHYLKH